MRQKSTVQLQTSLQSAVTLAEDFSFERFNQWIAENVKRANPNLRGTDLWE